MPDEPNREGQPQNTGSTGNQENQADGANPEAAPGATKAPQFITPDILTSVLKRQNASSEENTKKLIEAHAKQIAELLDSKLSELSKATPPTKGEGGKGSHGENAAALLELEKKAKDLEVRLQATDRARQDAEARERNYKFQTKVEAALARNKCTNTKLGFKAIEEYLKDDYENDKITAKVKDKQFGLGDVDVDLDTFIKGVFQEEIAPELFLGRIRPGAPAGGDNGSGGGASRTFKTSDIAAMTPEEYARNRDKIDEAQRAGRVLIDT